MDRINIIDAEISVTNMNDCVNYLCSHMECARGNYICASNAHTVVMAKENIEYRNIQNNSFMSLPDGKPLSVIGRRSGFTEMDRVTGPDFMERVLQLSAKCGWRHFFYGNTSSNMERLIGYIEKTYPDVEIAGYEPSVFRQLSAEEEKELIDKINMQNADFVWIGIGAPKQEIFCARHASKTNSVWVGVGGAFNVIAGIIPRAPEWMQNHGLEWCYRLIKEPKRLFKRYIITNTKFIYYLCKQFAKAKMQRGN